MGNETKRKWEKSDVARNGIRYLRRSTEQHQPANVERARRIYDRFNICHTTKSQLDNIHKCYSGDVVRCNSESAAELSISTYSELAKQSSIGAIFGVMWQPRSKHATLQLRFVLLHSHEYQFGIPEQP